MRRVPCISSLGWRGQPWSAVCLLWMPAGHFLPSLGNGFPQSRPLRAWHVDVHITWTQHNGQMQRVQRKGREHRNANAPGATALGMGELDSPALGVHRNSVRLL
jgi:hypothetical protein